MATAYEALKELRKNIDQIEIKLTNELNSMRQSIDQILAEHGEKPDDDWRSKIQWADKEALREWFEDWRKRNGVTYQPIGAEKLQEMSLKEGINPADNSFSRGIIEMREE